MFFLRKIGKLVRGQSSFQVYSACILAGMIAFLPGFRQAPGLMVTLIALLALLNANLFLAAAFGLIAKVIYWLMLPVLFHLGVWLVDGPPQPVFAAVANAPVTAWFGLEYYVVSAGLIIGPLVGLLGALLIHWQIIRLRRQLAKWEHDSENFHKWSNKGWVKLLAFVFIGGTKPDKGSWESLTRARMGNPIRPLGAVLILVVAVFLFIVVQFFDATILTAATRTFLERANGATVDVEEVTFDTTEGRLTITELAMADPEALNQNVFAAGVLSADLSGVSLLSRKLVIDRLEASDAETGSARRIPGQRVGPAPKPVEPPPETSDPDTYSIEEILAEAELWKERLGRIAEWVRKISPEEKPVDDPDRERNWRERLEERAQLLGYEAVASEELIRQAPTLEIREIVANGVRISQLPGEQVNFVAHHVSTQPWLLTDALTLTADAQSGKFGLKLVGTGYTSQAGANTLNYFYKDLAASEIASLLKNPSAFPVKEGVFTIEGSGSQEGIGINLPLNVTLRDAQVELAGFEPVNIASMQIPAAITGTLAAPALRVEASLFQNALKEAARGRLKQEAQERIKEAVGEDATERLRRILGGGEKP